MQPDLAKAAREAGATQLGEDGPDGAHWIFSQEQLSAFVALLAQPPALPPLPYGVMPCD